MMPDALFTELTEARKHESTKGRMMNEEEAKTIEQEIIDIGKSIEGELDDLNPNMAGTNTSLLARISELIDAKIRLVRLTPSEQERKKYRARKTPDFEPNVPRPEAKYPDHGNNDSMTEPDDDAPRISLQEQFHGRIADRIVDQLFLKADGERATRLVILGGDGGLRNENNCGSWSYPGAHDRIMEILKAGDT